MQQYIHIYNSFVCPTPWDREQKGKGERGEKDETRANSTLLLSVRTCTRSKEVEVDKETSSSSPVQTYIVG